MSQIRHNAKHVMLGIAILVIPVAAFLHKYGARSTLRTVLLVLAIYLIAKIAVYFFTRQSPAAKAAAVVLYPELLLLLFLPKSLKQKMSALKENELNNPRR